MSLVLYFYKYYEYLSLPSLELVLSKEVCHNKRKGFSNRLLLFENDLFPALIWVSCSFFKRAWMYVIKIIAKMYN